MNRHEQGVEKISRRRFLSTTAAGAGIIILKPELVRGTEANSAIRLGLLGCGGRGTSVATSFATHTSVRVVALADMFTDQLEAAKAHFDKFAESKGHAGIDSKLMFLGPQAFQQLASSKDIDMVQISTPDIFHAQHLEAVVSAGKHVYCEKPVAVDVTGCKRVLEGGKKADGRLSLDIGFQLRSAPPYVELVKRIHAGALGRIAHISAHYHATALRYPERGPISKEELRLRNWYWDKYLSGDILVDQNIHVIDMCNWMLKAHPVKAQGTGGRNVRSDWGNCWDHFAVNFIYPDDVVLSFNSVQFGEKLWDVTERVFGSKGVSESPYSGPVRIIGEEDWEWKDAEAKVQTGGQFSVTGEFTDNLQFADREKEKSFIDSITSGMFHNQAATGVESAMSVIMGRTAAYSGREVTWDEMIASNLSYEGEIKLSSLGLKEGT